VLTETVQSPTTLSVIASGPVTYGQPVTFTATISPSAARGNIQFTDGGTNLGTVALSVGIAALLTSLMILMFLGSWRSTLIIAISIPLSILTSLLVLSALGQTINIMTLGGLALAVGILVDDATVTIENIERQMASGKELLQAILDGAEQIAVPALVSTLSISTQILNFGLPAPIDIQIIGSDMPHNFSLAAQIAEQIRSVPGAVDVHLHQLLNQPRLDFAVDRVRTQQAGLSERDVASNVLVSLSSSLQTSPNFWLSPNGVSYGIAVQTPQYKVDSIDALRTIPVNSPAVAQPQLLENLAAMNRRQEPAVVTHYNVQRVIEPYAGTQGRDLGGVAAEISKITAAAEKQLPKGSSMLTRGQVATMRSSFVGLGSGLAFAIVLVYLLIVINFQSWSEAFIIITALPAALAGICWMLYLTQTTLSVPALMGTIMSMGVATANSVLIISFANERFAETKDALRAALDAGSTRLRPVMMTALGMIIGMVPMAIGMGEDRTRRSAAR
jgi:multidrug efflux pump subunit AcrB